MSTFFSKNLIYLRKKKGLNQTEAATALNLTRSTFSNYELSQSEPNLTKILEIAHFFGVTVDDLLSKELENAHLNDSKKDQKNTKNAHLNAHLSAHPIGQFEGNVSDIKDIYIKQKSPPEPAVREIIKPVVITVDNDGRENVVLVPVKARAGYLTGYGDPKFIHSLPSFRLPMLRNNTYRMFEVDGLSNYPTLHDKDIVVCSYVEQARFLRDDRMHVVVTKEHGVVIKRVLNRAEKDGKLILKSDNYADRHLYPPIVISPEDVLEIWYCEMRLTRQFGASDLYTRLVDLEGRLALLENKL